MGNYFICMFSFCGNSTLMYIWYNINVNLLSAMHCVWVAGYHLPFLFQIKRLKGKLVSRKHTCIKEVHFWHYVGVLPRVSISPIFSSFFQFMFVHFYVFPLSSLKAEKPWKWNDKELWKMSNVVIIWIKS